MGNCGLDMDDTLYGIGQSVRSGTITVRDLSDIQDRHGRGVWRKTVRRGAEKKTLAGHVMYDMARYGGKLTDELFHQLMDYLRLHALDLNEAGPYGYTPLHWAAFSNHIRCAKLLILAGAEVNYQSMDISRTPLHYAAETDGLDVASLLIQCGAKVQLKTTRGQTALDIANENESQQVIALLTGTTAL